MSRVGACQSLTPGERDCGWRMHPDAQGPLRAWLALMQSSSFEGFDELRRVFARADRVAGLTVFDIGGNKYRFSAADYDRGTWQGSNR